MGSNPVKTLNIIKELNITNGYQMMHYLRSRDLVETFDIGGQSFVKITSKGEAKILKLNIENIEIRDTEKWDGKWRIVIFDIPENYKLARNIFSRKLQELGFQQVQKSVYVLPFDCSEEIEKLRCFYGIRPYTFLITASEIESSEKLKNLFGLT